MFETRKLSTLILASALAGAGAYGAFAPPPAHAAGKPCTSKKFEFKEVEKACKDGGQKAAKKLMKGIVKKAKASGQKIKCKGCHEDMKTYELKDNAVEDMKKLM